MIPLPSISHVTLFCLQTLGWLYIVQITIQTLQQLGKLVLRNNSNWIVVFGHHILGVTGDAVPNRPFLKHEDLITYSSIVPATAITFLLEGYLESYHLVYRTFVGSCLGIVFAQFVMWFGVYTLFKFYPEALGAGLNLYWKGWRIIGFDVHQFQVRQDLKTGKPLQRHEQYLMYRPHIDLPPWEKHHWPWIRYQTASEMEETKSVKTQQRAEKSKNKAAKKARREAQLAERSRNGTSSESEDSIDSNSDLSSRSATPSIDPLDLNTNGLESKRECDPKEADNEFGDFFQSEAVMMFGMGDE